MNTPIPTPQARTPRTDAQPYMVDREGNPVVSSKHARQLETELTAATQEAEQAKKTLRSITPSLLNGRGCWTHEEIVEAVASLKSQLAEAQSQLKETQEELLKWKSKKLKVTVEAYRKLRADFDGALLKFAQDLTAAQAQEKMLRDALEEMVRFIDSEGILGRDSARMLLALGAIAQSTLANSAPLKHLP